MTLRPASATWSSAVTPGLRPTTRRASWLVASSIASSTTSDVVATAPIGSCSAERLGLGLGRRCRRRRSRTRSASSASCVRSRIHRGAGVSPSGRLPWRASNLLPLAGARARSAAKTSARVVSRSSAPRTSSASSSTNRSTTRERETTSTSSRLSSTRVSPSRTMRLRRSCRMVTSSTSGASPASSRTSERASDAGQSSGPAVRSAGPSSSSRRTEPPGPSVRASDLTDTIVPLPDRRNRTANPARVIAPSAVST